MQLISGRHVFFLAFISIGVCFFTTIGRAEIRESLNSNWRFSLGDAPDAAGTLAYGKVKGAIASTGKDLISADPTRKVQQADSHIGESISYVQPTFDDSAWRTLDLPHDFGIESKFEQANSGSTGKLTWWGVAWYRKTFAVPDRGAGKCYYLDIDGAMSYSMVWCNGHFVGGWPYGYTSYRLDLTPYLQPGKTNVLAIRLDNPNNSSRWYPGGGIYRNVWLVTTNSVHVDHWGATVTTPSMDDRNAQVHVRTVVVNTKKTTVKAGIRTEIYELDSSGNPVGSAVAKTESMPIEIEAESKQLAEQDMSVNSPKRWSLSAPNRYVAVTTIEEDAQVSDICQTAFGIRTIRFDADKGFLLNGTHLKINGVCNHSDLGALGTAINVDAMARQISLLKEMGCNALRMCHNPPAPELLELCDRIGMLVMDEAFDCWANQKNNNDYHVLFWDWHERDLRALIRRDRNHPCVILWSTGNEIGEQGWADGHKISTELAKIVHEEDATRLATAACDQPVAGWNGFQKTVDVFGYNYKPGLYAKAHETTASLPIFGSETASCLSSRGEYFFPITEQKQDFQISSYDLMAPGWGSTPDLEFKSQDEHPFVCGEFVWTGFDYLGEPTPYNNDMTILSNFSDPAAKARMAEQLKAIGKIQVPSRSSYFGILDLAGFKKDRFYLYQARWQPDLPMAHLMPHWTWPGREGQVTPVQVYTSGDEAELFVNGQSQGRKKRCQFDYRLRWDSVKYAPGEIHVVAYRAGKIWAEDTVRTAGTPAQIQLLAEKPVLPEGGTLRYITARVTDADGNPVPRAKNLIAFKVSGPAEIVATDNGDPIDLTSFQSHERNAFNGLALVIIRLKLGAAGPIELDATSPELANAKIRIEASK